MNFFAQRAGGRPKLVQVCLDAAVNTTWEREVRALSAAARAYPDATALLVTLDSSPPIRDLPSPIEWRPATRWLLEAETQVLG